MTLDYHSYRVGAAWDELMAADGVPRSYADRIMKYLSTLDEDEMAHRHETMERCIKSMGITFTVYSDGDNIDRAWPLDLIPRMIERAEWEHTKKGLIQRLSALNMFIDDLYNEQRIVKDGIFPTELLENSKNFRSQCVGAKPRYGAWSNICGSDLVRNSDGQLYVLEDNLRVPSGVSYMLENRQVMKRVFPEMFANHPILPVDDYCRQLFNTLASLSPRQGEHPEICVLTPGIFNSAYFEHSYLAQQMGAELVEGRDLFVDSDDCVYMKTIYGKTRVDVIYRRIDDEFLDPEAFRADSTLGVPGLMRAWRKGNVAIANAPGAGVADDKAVYAFVPKFINYYLNEEPLIPNVPTHLCFYPEERDYVLNNIANLVVKPANESGGYGILIGPHADQKTLKTYRDLIIANPRNYIAQPVLSLSTAPTLCEGDLKPRHLDLRPFILQAEESYVTTGGLTRVALREGSLVVNSSQGGGSKDTWIIDADEWPIIDAINAKNKAA